MKIALIPLDERPVNTRYPAMIAAIAGAEVALPPAELLSALRHPADGAALGRWLLERAPGCDALIVSLEQLGYGGLIAARTTAEPAAAILARLEALRQLRRSSPSLTIYGFSVITRVSNANDAVEEPAYWATYGERLYALSQLLDRRRQGHPVDAELARLEAAIPAEHRRDFLARRLRNHAVNLASLGLLEDGTLDLLVLSSDDTSPYGLPSAEKAWLAGWGELLSGERRAQSAKQERSHKPDAVSEDLQSAKQERSDEPGAVSEGAGSRPALDARRLLMYPGADEVACALVARLLNARAGAAPAVAVRYAPAAAAANVAAYEDGPISRTVERQIAAVGGRLEALGGLGQGAAGPAIGYQLSAIGYDLLLAVNAPVARRAEWDADHAAEEREARLPALRELVADVRAHLALGVPVAIADVAYPNGADPALAELLLADLELPALAAYGAWNTAGNTIGTALAQACAAQRCATPAGRAAQERFLLHRLVEDWGYQHHVRAEVRAWLRETTGHHDPRTPEAATAAIARIEAGLNAAIARLPGFAGRYRIAPGSVRLPWGRTFEVDFALEAQDQ